MMTQGRQGANAYAKTQVTTTTSQQELIVMAYDGILKFLRQGREHLINREFEQKHIYLCKAKSIIEELASTLNMEKGGEIASTLWNLYLFFLQRITEANIANDASKIDEIVPSIEELREGWAQMVVPKDDAEMQALNRRAAVDHSSHLRFTG